MTTSTNLIANILTICGPAFHGGDPEATASQWEAHGFGADDVEAWVEADCFDPTTAARFRDAGVTPANARREAPRSVAFGVTVAYATANGDMTVAAAVAFLAS